MAGLVVSAAIVSGNLVLGLDSGEIINCGYCQGAQGLQGPPGAVGATGRPGADGNTILHSAGRPRPDLGKEGDWVIDSVHWEIFGPKSGGTWGRGQSLLVGGELGGLDQGGKTVKGSPRFFPMGGVSSAVAPAPPTTAGGLDPIIGNGNPFGANIWSPVAIDPDGDLMEVTMYFSRSGGNEVYTAKIIAYRANTIGNLTIAWESAQPQQLPYTVEFDAQITGTQLQLNVRSSTNWEAVRGKINRL